MITKIKRLWGLTKRRGDYILKHLGTGKTFLAILGAGIFIMLLGNIFFYSLALILGAVVYFTVMYFFVAIGTAVIIYKHLYGYLKKKDRRKRR